MGKVIGIDLGTTNSCVAIMEGGTADVMEALHLLTHLEPEPGFNTKRDDETLETFFHRLEVDYLAYIERLADHPIARAVKWADLNDNIGDGLIWPASLGFVHVHELLTETINGTEHFMISPALRDEFIPHRERVFESYLREACQSCQLPLTRSSRNFSAPEMSPISMPSDRGVTLGAWVEELDAELKASWPNDTIGGPTPTH